MVCLYHVDIYGYVTVYQGEGMLDPWTSTIHIHSPIGLNMYIKYMYQYDNWITLTTKLPDNWYCAHKRAYTPPRVLYWMNSMASSSEAWAYNWGKCLLTGAIILINFNSNCYSNAWNNPLSRPGIFKHVQLMVEEAHWIDPQWVQSCRASTVHSNQLYQLSI